MALASGGGFQVGKKKKAAVEGTFRGISRWRPHRGLSSVGDWQGRAWKLDSWWLCGVIDLSAIRSYPRIVGADRSAGPSSPEAVMAAVRRYSEGPGGGGDALSCCASESTTSRRRPTRGLSLVVRDAASIGSCELRSLTYAAHG
jgi:hypothetical protein